MYYYTEDSVNRSLAGAVALVTAYWGAVPEIKFPIDSQILKRMFGTSPTNLVGLRVENFNDPTIVSATWVSFDVSTPPGDSTSANVYYSMFDLTLFNAKIAGAPPFNIVNARFGRKPTGEFCVFFHKTRVIGKGGGTGGVVDGSGAIVR